MKTYTWDYTNSETAYKNLYVTCKKAALRLYKWETSIVKFDIETTPQIISIFQSLDSFTMDEKIDILSPIHKVGTIENCDLYRRMYLKESHVIIKANGKTAKVNILGL